MSKRPRRVRHELSRLQSDDDGSHDVAFLEILLDAIGMVMVTVCAALFDGEVRREPFEFFSIRERDHFELRIRQKLHQSLDFGLGLREIRTV